MSTKTTDLVHIARQLSLIWGNFARLGMTHFISAERLHKRYLLRLRQDMATSEATGGLTEEVAHELSIHAGGRPMQTRLLQADIWHIIGNLDRPLDWPPHIS